MQVYVRARECGCTCACFRAHIYIYDVMSWYLMIQGNQQYVAYNMYVFIGYLAVLLADTCYQDTYSFTLWVTLHYTTLHYTTLHYTTLHYTTLHYTTLHYTTLHYTTLHYPILHYTTLHYTTLQYTWPTLHGHHGVAPGWYWPLRGGHPGRYWPLRCSLTVIYTRHENPLHDTKLTISSNVV